MLHNNTFSSEEDPPRSQESADTVEEQRGQAVCASPDIPSENSTSKNNQFNWHRPESNYFYEI